MPEGDTVFRQAAQLHQHVAGGVLVGSDFRVPQYATSSLASETVENVVARGKHLLIRVGESTIQSHLKMEGTWQVYPRGQSRWKRPAHTARCVLTTETAQAVGFSLGELNVIPRAEEETFLAHLGPDLLGPDWDLAEAAARLRAQPERAIGVGLLDQRNLAGIGNIYRNEICFLARLAPETPVEHVPNLETILELSQRLLHVNRLRSRRSTLGTATAGAQFWVYGREGQACLRCRSRIQRYEMNDDGESASAVARAVYVCPHCQPAV